MRFFFCTPYNYFIWKLLMLFATFIELFDNSKRCGCRPWRSYVDSSTSFMMLSDDPVLSREHYMHPHPVNRECVPSRYVILLCLRRGKTRNDDGAWIRIQERRRAMGIAGQIERIAAEVLYLLGSYYLPNDTCDLPFIASSWVLTTVNFSRVYTTLYCLEGVAYPLLSR